MNIDDFVEKVVAEAGPTMAERDLGMRFRESGFSGEDIAYGFKAVASRVYVKSLNNQEFYDRLYGSD
jgi:hypothetical protein